jgi:glycosyltransferase involved in cell wall biosynthesis
MVKKKIFFVVNSLNPGGMQSVIKILADGLSKEFDTNIIFFGGDNFKLDNVNFLRLEKKYRLFHLLKIFLKQKNKFIVIPFGITKSLDVIALKFFKNFKIIATERNDPLKKISKLKRKLIDSLIFKADALVLQNKYQFNYYKNLTDKNKIHRIKNPIHINSKIQFKSGNNLLSIGRLTNQKNQLDLIEIFGKLNHDIKLFLVGYGENHSIIKEKIINYNLQNKILIQDSLENINLNEIGLFISTSLYEGMPNVILEALNMGLRCIQYDFNGNDFKTDLITSIEQRNIQKFVCEINSKLKEDTNIPSEDFIYALKAYDHNLIINKWKMLIINLFTQ